jgi:hypothetical protein
LSLPSDSSTSIGARWWRLPISKSTLSWAGVIFSAPVPNSLSTTASAMIGISAAGHRALAGPSGRSTLL